MSSSSSSTPASSAPVGASTVYSATLGHPASARPHATSEITMASEAGPALDRRSGRRRSTVTGSDRKRRLVNAEGDVWSRQSVSGSVTEPEGRTIAEMDSRSIPSASPMRPESSAPGASYLTPIELSLSPPDQRPRRTNDRRSSWSRAGNDYLEYTRPRWQPDSEVTNCPICETAFSFWYRKHHCRKCGRVVCASCSPHRITIPRQFIVHPPDTNRSRASTLIPPRVAPIVDLESDDSAQSPTALNPALGGGEVVRLCNPCVPDPNPEPLRGYTTIRAPGEPQSGSGCIQGGYSASNQSRHRPYHSLSSPTRHPPYAAIPESFSARSPRRAVGSNEYHMYGGSGGSLGSRFQERPMEYGSLSAARFAPSMVSSGRPLPLAPGSAMLSAGPSFATSADQELRLPISAPRRRVDERDLCPICDHVLPPLDMNGAEDAREAHIRHCIESHGPRARSSSHSSSSSPAAQSSLPVRMIAFTATEKDCIGHDGSVQECTICMEEYEVSQPLVRLECLCKFHKRCIVEWFERKRECPVHKVS